jgi:predicted permease
MSELLSELRYVLRVLRRSPGFSLVAVLSLAIGIGANTAMFGVVRTLLLTPLPVERSGELKLLAWNRQGDFDIGQYGSTQYVDPETGANLRSNFSYPLYRALRDAAPSGVSVFGFAFLRGVSVALGDQPAVYAGGAMADGAYFSSLGVPMAVGRGIGPEDDVADAPVVAVLSHALWMRAFGGDPAVVGRTIRVNGEAAQVIGVTAVGFKGLSMGGFFPQTEITVPISAQPRVYARLAPDESLFTSDRVFWLRLMARIPEGVSGAATQQALAAAMRAMPSPLLAADGFLPELRLLEGAQGAQPIAASTARLLYFLLGVVGIVLLIACVNLASLMLARGVARQREMAVRRALGGGRGRLVRQLFLEALVLALAGTGAGLLLTWFGREALVGLLSGSLGTGAFSDVDLQVSLDTTVLAVSTVLALSATLACGLLPALRIFAFDPIRWLKQRGADASNPRLGAGRALIAVQIAVSVPLVVGAALFLRTVHNLGAVELGFDPQGLVSFKVDPGFTRLPESQYPRLYQELLSRIEEIPEVRSVTLVENAPLSGIVSNSSMDVDGKRVVVYANGIGPAFLETLGARLVSGRMPGLQDGPDDALVAAINEKAVQEIYGGESPLGRTLRWGGQELRIVGVINDMPYRSHRDGVPPTVYPSAFQRSANSGYHVFLRTDAPLGGMESILREAVMGVDPDVPVPTLRAETEIMAQTSAKERVFAQLLTIFGAFALLLASIGLYGVTSYAVTRRTSEFGVRVAIGARPGQILWLVLRQVVLLAAIGLVAGVPAALAATPLVASLLYGVAPTSPWAVISAAVVMLAVAVGAGLLPALRASRLEAVAALRVE